MEERRANGMDEAKFFTQKAVTFVLLAIFTGVTATVLYQQDQSERSMVLQTVINLTLLAVGYWLGSSKGASDSNDAIGKIIKPQSEAMVRIAEAAPAPIPPAADPSTAVPDKPKEEKS